jgi:hypothetical protein
MGAMGRGCAGKHATLMTNELQRTATASSGTVVFVMLPLNAWRGPHTFWLGDLHKKKGIFGTSTTPRDEDAVPY